MEDSPRKEVLLVIEAPGKIDALDKALRACGWRHPTRIFATKGHLFTNPRSLTPLGIDTTFTEHLRAPVNPAVIAELRRLVTGRDVIVMTDPDDEGDVIALDTAIVARHGGAHSISRARCAALEPSQVLNALRNRGPVVPGAAVPGRGRAIVDRLIGGVLSHRGRAVGRVLSAVLRAIKDGRPAVGDAILHLPSADHGPPFVAAVPVASASEAEELQRACAELPPMRGRPAAPRPPAHTGEIMIEMDRRLDLKPERTSRILQSLYMSGALSYPRSDGRYLPPSAVQTLATSMRRAGCVCRPAATDDDGQGSGHHPAPHPLQPVALRAEPERLPVVQAVLVTLARDLARRCSGREEEPEWVLPDWARRAGFRRLRGAPLPGGETRPPGFYPWHAETAVLSVLLDYGLGRPSTWANHATEIVERGLVAAHRGGLELTPKGEMWLEAAGGIADVALSRRLEMILRGAPGSGWRATAAAAVGALPEAERMRVRAALAESAQEANAGMAVAAAV